MKTAKVTDWKTLPLPDEHVRIAFDARYALEEMDVIKRGVIPKEMEHKWFIYWQDDKLFFHRSWTGFCLYVLRFVCDDEGASAVEADVNRDPQQYKNTDDQYDAELIVYLIDAVLLRRPARFPSESSSDTKRALEQWSQVGRAGLGEHPGGEDS